ncbi:hypothetical protein G6F42_028299 [Rhizopus arrhizus]|nr:hypothetical protein G6F42_028299 [Rhizopus arrhizus]
MLCLQLLFSKFKSLTWESSDVDNDLQDPPLPDGCIGSDDHTIGYLKIKPFDKAEDDMKINMDLYRLGVFSKVATTKHQLKHIFRVMAEGYNLPKRMRGSLQKSKSDVFRLKSKS